MSEIHRAQRLGRQAFPAGKRAQPFQGVMYAGWRLEAELDRVEAQCVRVAGEQENANDEVGSRGDRHDLKLPPEDVTGNG